MAPYLLQHHFLGFRLSLHYSLPQISCTGNRCDTAMMPVGVNSDCYARTSWPLTSSKRLVVRDTHRRLVALPFCMSAQFFIAHGHVVVEVRTLSPNYAHVPAISSCLHISRTDHLKSRNQCGLSSMRNAPRDASVYYSEQLKDLTRARMSMVRLIRGPASTLSSAEYLLSCSAAVPYVDDTSYRTSADALCSDARGPELGDWKYRDIGSSNYEVAQPIRI